MLARVRETTVADIAARVDQPRRLRDIEARRKLVRARYAVLRDEITALVQEDPHRHAAQINRLVAEDSALAKEAAQLKSEAEPLRQSHGAAVAAALRPIHKEAARKALGLIDDLIAAYGILDEINVAIESAGGACVRTPLPALNFAAATLQRVLAAAE